MKMKKKVNTTLSGYSTNILTSHIKIILAVSFLVISISAFGIAVHNQKQKNKQALPSSRGLVSVSATSPNTSYLSRIRLANKYSVRNYAEKFDQMMIGSPTEITSTNKNVVYIPQGQQLETVVLSTYAYDSQTITEQSMFLNASPGNRITYQYKSPNSSQYSQPVDWVWDNVKMTALPRDREIGLWRNKLSFIDAKGGVALESYAAYRVTSATCPEGGIHIQYAKGRNANALKPAWYPDITNPSKTQMPQVKSSEFMVTRIVDGKGQLIDLNKYAILYKFGKIHDLGEIVWDDAKENGSMYTNIWNTTITNPKSARPPANTTSHNVERVARIALMGNSACNANSGYIVLPN